MRRPLAVLYLLPLIGVLLLATAISVRSLNADGIWYDEWWSLYNAGAEFFTEPLNPVQIWDRLSTDDPWQPPGYPWVLALWGNTVGWSEFTGRALSLFAGLIAIALMARFTLAISRSPVAAVCAAALLGGSAWFLYYTHEMRVYTLYLACAIAFLYAYWRIAVQPRRRSLSYLAVAVTGSMFLYMHPYALLVYGVIGIWHLSRLRRASSRQGWIAASLALASPAALFLPWVSALFYAAQRTQAMERAAVDLELLGRIATTTFYVFSSTGTILFVLLAIFSVFTRGAKLAWGLLILLMPITLAVFYAVSVSEIRYAIALMPLYALIGGLGAAELHRRRIPYPILLILWIVPAIVVGSEPRFGMVMQDTYPPPIREMAAALHPYLTDDASVIDYVGTEVVPNIHAEPLVHYFGVDRVSILDMRTSVTLDAFINRFENAIAGRDRVWLLVTPLWEMREWALLQHLLGQRGYQRCTVLEQTDVMEIYAYARTDTRTPALRFGDMIIVRPIGAVDVLPDRAVVWLGIDSAAPSDTYSAGVYLLDSSGTAVRQVDQGVQAGDSCWWGELSLTGLPPGDYTAVMSVYNWQTVEPLPGIGINGETGDILPLGSVHIGTRPDDT